MSTVVITADEAIAAATAQAWTEQFDEGEDRGREPRTLIHSVSIGSGMMLGADWDLFDLVAALHEAQEIVWFDDFMGHELAMKTADGRVLKFEVKRPAAS